MESKKGPHQYQNIFYKRISDGNEPMQVDEIKRRIIESEKKEVLLQLFLQEGGLVKNKMEEIKKCLAANELLSAISICDLLHTSASEHFLYDQSYLYSHKVYDGISRIIEVSEKLFDLRETFEDLLNSKSKNFNMKSGQKTYTAPEEYIKDTINDFLDMGLLHFNNIEIALNVKFIKPATYDELLKLYKDEIKK